MLERMIARLLLLVSLLSGNAWSDAKTGTIHTLHVNLASNLAHIYLDGSPLFDGGSCLNKWTGNSLNDEKFKSFIWPVLMTTSVTNQEVMVSVVGCNGSFPIIEWVDLNPRE